jgi:hypothetical protein
MFRLHFGPLHASRLSLIALQVTVICSGDRATARAFTFRTGGPRSVLIGGFFVANDGAVIARANGFGCQRRRDRTGREQLATILLPNRAVQGPYDAVRVDAARPCFACDLGTSQDEAVPERTAKTEFADRCVTTPPRGRGFRPRQAPAGSALLIQDAGLTGNAALRPRQRSRKAANLAFSEALPHKVALIPASMGDSQWSTSRKRGGPWSTVRSAPAT